MKKYKTVYGLLKNPNRWTRDAMAKNKCNEVVGVLNVQACCFCLSGAIQKIYGDSTAKHLYVRDKVKDIIAERRGYRDIVYFNDHTFTNHKDILKVLKLAKV